VYNECKTTNQKIWNGVFLNVSWTYNRCTKSGNRKNATGETGIRQKEECYSGKHRVSKYKGAS